MSSILSKKLEKIEFESWCNPEGGFNPALLANDIAQNYEIRTDVLNDVLYFYDPEKGIYDRNGDMILRHFIDDLLKKENRQHRTIETIFIVHSKSHAKIDFSKKIAVENGLLDVKTGELTPFTPNEFVTIRIPVRYDKTASCPTIMKFLNEVMLPDQVPIAQECFGYCLLLEYLIRKTLVLLGEGHNGKTTFLNLLNAFLGPENCSHATLQRLCEGKFELAQLYGKLANICDDLPGDALKSVGNFKNLTGNAPIQAQFKYKNPFDFWNTAKLLWACNKLPAASEDTSAYYGRFIILNFTKIFLEGVNADVRILEKLTTPQELSGLLNWALEGLTHLLKNGAFSTAKTMEETRAQYIRTADSSQAFLEEMAEYAPDPKVWTKVENLYQQYVEYCRTNKLPIIKQKRDITLTMQRVYPYAKQTKQREAKNVFPVWQYIKLKSVPSVPSVPPFLSLSQTLIESVEKNRTLGTNGTNGTDVTRPSIREVLDKVKAQFNEGPEEEWIGFAVEAGLSKKEAEELFESLKGKELFLLPDGNWRWVRA